AAADPVGEPAGQRRRDGRGYDIGGEDPVDLVLAGPEAGTHMRQGDIGDGRVEHLHDHRHHDGGSEQALVPDDDGRGRECSGGGHFQFAFAASGTVPSGLVSTLTTALMPARNGWSATKSTLNRTGTRWVTFTQLPV